MCPICRFEDYYGTAPRKPQKEFSLPLGVRENGELEMLQISQRDSRHILISGDCGSGKSVCLHTLINSILLSYSPLQVNLWLYDYKGCEFLPFYRAAPPHVTGQWIGGSREGSLSFFNALENEVNRRLHFLSQTDTPTYDRYVRCNETPKLPRLVVFIDEYGAFQRDISEYDPAARTRLTSIIRMAHAVGILFAATIQDISFYCHLLTDEWSVRISTRQREQNIMLLYHTFQVAAMAKDLCLGEAIVNVPAPHKVKLLYLSYEVERQILADLAK